MESNVCVEWMMWYDLIFFSSACAQPPTKKPPRAAGWLALFARPESTPAGFAWVKHSAEGMGGVWLSTGSQMDAASNKFSSNRTILHTIK